MKWNFKNQEYAILFIGVHRLLHDIRRVLLSICYTNSGYTLSIYIIIQVYWTHTFSANGVNLQDLDKIGH